MYLEACGRFCSFLDVFGRGWMWTYLDVFVRIWVYLIWTYLAIFGRIWTYLDVFGRIWMYLDVFERIWTYLDVFPGKGVLRQGPTLEFQVRSTLYRTAADPQVAFRDLKSTPSKYRKKRGFLQ